VRHQFGGGGGQRIGGLHAVLSAMQAISLGLIQIPSPGTPVPVTTDDSLRVMLMMVVRTVPGFTGKTYLGLAGMDRNSASKTDVIRILSEPPAFGPQDGEVLPGCDRWPRQRHSRRRLLGGCGRGRRRRHGDLLHRVTPR
jgi:hypothetical protein